MATANIGDKIRRCRKQKGMTQAELGAKLGVSQALIGQYETGKRKPKIEQLSKLAAALEVNEFELAATQFSEFQQEVLKKHEEEFIDYLYSLGYTITKIDALNYKVKSDRYNWTTNITKEELDIIKETGLEDFFLQARKRLTDEDYKLLLYLSDAVFNSLIF